MKNKGIKTYYFGNGIKDDTIIPQDYIRCECGHTMRPKRNNKCLCTFCGKYVFKDKKEEFIYRLEHLI